jgi:hypothetical protein
MVKLKGWYFYDHVNTLLVYFVAKSINAYYQKEELLNPCPMRQDLK